MAARPRTTRRSTPVEKTEKEKSKAKDRESELPLVPVASENSKRPRLEVEASAVTTTSPSPLSVVRLNVGGTRFETTYGMHLLMRLRLLLLLWALRD